MTMPMTQTLPVPSSRLAGGGVELPSAAEVRLEVRPFIEPLSGLHLLRVSVTWDWPLTVTAACHSPANSPPTDWRLEVRSDGRCASQAGVVRVFAADVPAGHARLGAGVQLPVEPAQRLEAVIVARAGELRIPFSLDTFTPTPQPTVFQRWRRRLLSAEAWSGARWAARINRWSEAILNGLDRFKDRRLRHLAPDRSPYDAYQANTQLTPAMRSALADEILRFRYRPTFSLLMPVYNVDPCWLKAAIASVQAQIYPHWQLCIADDASSRRDLTRYLDHLPGDPRIRRMRRSRNGHICAATNAAADLATGDFVAFMDHDDALAPDALFHLAAALQRQPEADLLYSDEDKVDCRGRRYDPHFKPDWSPELLLSYNYVNHLTAVRRSLFDALGRLREGYEGAQDHDLLLRLSERTTRVVHIPRVLYHWRSLPSSTASAASVKSYVSVSSQRAVADALARRGLTATVQVASIGQRLHLPILELRRPADADRWGILVYGEPDAIRRTSHALRKTLGSTAAGAAIVEVPIAETEHQHTAEILNQAAAQRNEDALLFLEAGLEPTTDDWWSSLTAYLDLPGVAAVAGRIIDHHGRLLSAGSILGARDDLGPDEAFAGLTPGQVSNYFLAECARNLSAARARCLAVKRPLFETLGGFDTRRYPHSLWSIDFCLRLRGAGQRIAYAPGAEFRALAPLPPDPPSELLALKTAWGRMLDPFHNANWCSSRAFQLPSDIPMTARREGVSPPLKLLAVSPSLNPTEGAPRWLLTVIEELTRRQTASVKVWSPTDGFADDALGVITSEVASRPMPWARRFTDGQWTAGEYGNARRWLQAFLRQASPDVILINTLLAFPVVDAAWSLGLPTLWVLHESYSESQRQALFPEWTQRRIAGALRQADRVVAVSHGCLERYRRHLVRGNEAVIPNGLAKAEFAPPDRRVRQAARQSLEIPADKTVLLSVGTVCERKGQHTLVEAAARLAQTRDDFVFLIVGLRDGVPYGEYVRQLVERRNVSHVVRLVAETREVQPYFQAADLFVHASHLEAYSLAILEAEAYGLPIVATPCVGVDEQVVWGWNALRFARDDADGLAAVLGPLLDDSHRRQQMARQSRAMFELHLSDKEMIDRYESLLVTVAQQGHRGQVRSAPGSAVPPGRKRQAA